MADYADLSEYEAEKANWIARRLLRLRALLRVSRLGNRKPGNLVIGSWNIRAFDDGKVRRDESYHYIAEIISHFDICAVQEVKSDLDALRRLVKLLGKDWDYFVTDVTEGDPGNRERLAFLYNTNKVKFRNLIGEFTLPNDQLLDQKQFARTPFFASFQAGWFRFTLMTVHILYGSASAAGRAARAAEVTKLAEHAAKRAKLDDEVYVLIGDMNIDRRGDKIMKGLTNSGFTVPDFGPTNLGGTKFYDQIAFSGEDVKTHLMESGTFDWRDAVYGDRDKAYYKTVSDAQRKKPFKNWDRAFQTYFASFEMSDHLPIWVEIKTDYSDSHLEQYLI